MFLYSKPHWSLCNPSPLIAVDSFAFAVVLALSSSTRFSLNIPRNLTLSIYSHACGTTTL